MRVATIQDTPPQGWLFQGARWGGAALLVYAGLHGLEIVDAASGVPGGVWNLVAAILPLVATAVLLLFSAERLQPSASQAPLWLAGVLILVVAAMAARAASVGEPMLAANLEAGFWGAVRVLSRAALPLSVLLVLIAGRDVAQARAIPWLAVLAGVLLATMSSAVSLREVLQADSPGVWRVIHGVVPSSGFAFVLVVAGVYDLAQRRAGQLALGFVAALLVSVVALNLDRLQSEFSVSGWLVLSSLTFTATHGLLILAFAGCLKRQYAYAGASICLAAILASSLGLVFDADANEDGIFWLFSFNVAIVGAWLLLALVTVEVLARLGDAERASKG